MPSSDEVNEQGIAARPRVAGDLQVGGAIPAPGPRGPLPIDDLIRRIPTSPIRPVDFDDRLAALEDRVVLSNAALAQLCEAFAVFLDALAADDPNEDPTIFESAASKLIERAEAIG